MRRLRIAALVLPVTITGGSGSVACNLDLEHQPETAIAGLGPAACDREFDPHPVRGSGLVQKKKMIKRDASGPGQPNPSVVSAFDRFDSSGDGFISHEEFNTLDSSGDGFISREEWTQKQEEGITTPVQTPRTSKSTPAPVAPTPSVDLGPLSQAQKDAILKKHNELRRNMEASDMTEMAWDDSLAVAAQQWAAGGSLLLTQDVQQDGQHVLLASNCPRGHSGNRPFGVGENMAWSWSSDFQLTPDTDFTGSVQEWYDEIKDSGLYEFGGLFEGFDKCTGVCGHYTQVVWASANKLGCGAALCPHSTGMLGYILVCQYGSTVPGGYGGNMRSATLFTLGPACSHCPAGFEHCSNDLCSQASGSGSDFGSGSGSGSGAKSGFGMFSGSGSGSGANSGSGIGSGASSGSGSEQTSAPTVAPTLEPTLLPTLETPVPTSKPTLEPTPSPTLATLEPTLLPTLEPTALPSLEPTSLPTIKPTIRPTIKPTSKPTAKPTLKPTALPTMEPTAAPTSQACDESLSGTKDEGYRGCQTTTISGKTCQKWTSQSPHGHGNTPDKIPNKGLGDHNYCRNPDGEPTIWCYTADRSERWEFCEPIEAASAIVCGSHKFCVGWEDRQVYCYGSSSGCKWGHNDCQNDNDCNKYSAASPKYTDGDSPSCPASGWRGDAPCQASHAIEEESMSNFAIPSEFCQEKCHSSTRLWKKKCKWGACRECPECS